MVEISLLLRNLQTSRANNSRIFRIKNAKLTGYCFYMNTGTQGDFQICICVSLIENMKKLFRLNTCQVEAIKSIINTDITIELNLFVFKRLFKINDKINSSTTHVTFPLFLMLTLDKKLSFTQYLYFGRNNEAIKTAKKISMKTLIIRGFMGIVKLIDF